MFHPPTDPAGALRLHYNENTAGCSPRVLAALRSLSAEDIAAYPDYVPITACVSGWLGVSPEQLTLTNGLDEGLHMVAQFAAWHMDLLPAGAGARPQFVVAEPAFEMFEEFAGVVRAELIRVPPAEDFRFPLTALLQAVTPQTRAVYLVDPNNPTGQRLPAGAAEAIAAAVPDALVFVDEAYADFSGHTLIGPALDRYPNLVVGRTFAKGHGLAGLRVGGLVAHADTIMRLRQVQPPFNVNIAAVRALEAALDAGDHLAWYVAQAAQSRELVYAFCRRHGLVFWPSEANFVLVRVGVGAARVAKGLAERGVLVRDKSAAPGCAGCLRLTTGVVEHTARMLAGLEEILASRQN